MKCMEKKSIFKIARVKNEKGRKKSSISDLHSNDGINVVYIYHTKME